tara:strand:+ start:378 stop:1676 length:1299 start_codon:yes stop_codon:yes gene_type:complete
MPNNFKNELEWRGLIQDITNGFDDEIKKNCVSAYIGFDPTSDSLHIGSLVQLVILRHFQICGHKPIVLIGGATGMIGDPSGKSKERNLLSADVIEKNISALKIQFSKFLDFDEKNPNAAIIVNNYEWNSKLNIIEFFRDFGKLLTVNYMISKDSVKKRISNSDLSEGMSFTEFTYQLFQAYDFYYLIENYNCTIQMGGSDQWGNITSGVELIRKKNGKKAYALTCPLITKSDGSKFGKTEEGNVWLDRKKTSPYKFYQYWLNSSDEDSYKYVKIFTFAKKEFIEKLIKDHNDEPHLRKLQKFIAKEITTMVHSEQDLENVKKASYILFGKNTEQDLSIIDEETFLDVFSGVPHKELTKSEFTDCKLAENLLEKSGFFSSKSEIRRLIDQNSISINKDKINTEFKISDLNLINNKYILLQKGKKNYFLISLIT